LIGAAAIVLMAGIAWELIGNKDKWDILADLCGITLAVILIGV